MGFGQKNIFQKIYHWFPFVLFFPIAITMQRISEDLQGFPAHVTSMFHGEDPGTRAFHKLYAKSWTQQSLLCKPGRQHFFLKKVSICYYTCTVDFYFLCLAW